jgi:hypothetical protein
VGLGINHRDPRTPVQSFLILGLRVPPGHIEVAGKRGWLSFINAERDGTTSISFLAYPGYEIYPGQQTEQFWVYVAEATNTGRGGFCIAGGQIAVCAGLNVAAW